MGEHLSELLESIAAFFRSLNMPKPIVQWGHPVMMGIVVFVMGSYVAYAGWRSRITKDGEVAMKNRADHRQLAPLMTLFIALGYTGGILSLVMQEKPILESSHFWTGSVVLILLTINGILSVTGFGGEKKERFRTIHAYVGSSAMILLIAHAIFGLNLGFSL
ncbi:DUF4079 domain-containing protein [Candidatus Gracilibacteria bacterium]|nr:DUF4079 domain-containing protein [Candidatus Gracilibacteria bacterium]NJM87237.1 DUF4079 domain-containing protein [Hydrococcus sp. RU_2_2]NJP18649.1 DUF4079 domain-containing protein [Hydrococcus sp. CRU_1_1]